MRRVFHALLTFSSFHFAAVAPFNLLPPPDPFPPHRMMEGKMLELSQLLGLFTGKLLEQQDQVEEIHEAARGTHDNVGQANHELLATLDRNSKASQTMLTFVFVLCLALLILDQVIP